ncbi:DUF1842 domain-containing protein [Planctobacterium marinum]|uniref:DUF1842 domain-containing protein n=1 Tax=Planctobacterium marinum TaxID=1631968 RepID=UPI002B4C1AAD|nr:DUF1842 domain-containing protein [Planctobacterium marinum]MCC2607703.1 DUF1842 domain-containing protein [Planctobacterium marinum]
MSTLWSDTGLYLLKLSFNPQKGVVGSGSMTLAVTVDAASGELHGQAQGTILEGTEHPQSFTAKVSGAMHSTGYGNIVRVGAVNGEASLPFTPPAIGFASAPFSASFSLDSSWKGEGQFKVGNHTYQSEVRMVD